MRRLTGSINIIFSHAFGEKFSKLQWIKEIHGQREILHLYGGVALEASYSCLQLITLSLRNYTIVSLTQDVRGMRAPFLQIGGNYNYTLLVHCATAWPRVA